MSITKSFRVNANYKPMYNKQSAKGLWQGTSRGLNTLNCPPAHTTVTHGKLSTAFVIDSERVVSHDYLGLPPYW